METQHNAFLRVALWVVSHFSYEICELRRRPVESRCIEFIIRPDFLTTNLLLSIIFMRQRACKL
ncbi:hypothetical protein MAL06_13765 [Leptospira noguchii]|nr:hypothetical protein [Leptospira noguchii]UOG32260.1 hypothetical protein MAL06_13765 [Leptospira noguchii]